MCAAQCADFVLLCRYTRNLVDEGNGRYNLIVLCWPEGKGRYIIKADTTNF